ncbi:nitroreductase family protein [Kordiimonas gwangyangensis]|uniref:nitroreductase family protein n=1 Tax=Kordiimonas gwangyangensis TaxID=288022 RepID=UPI000362EA19|nr:nitroreductase family protein [Kordiimonas gwangyangensis]
MQPHDNVPLPDYIEYDEGEMRARAAEFLADIRRRHTVRDFSDRPVPQEIIEDCIRAAATAPSGANHQPWHFALIKDPDIKAKVRLRAEAEERGFYDERKAGEEWLDALAPLGTDASKPYLESAPWLIAIFAQRRGGVEVGMERKNYYVAESVGIATGFLIAALHNAGLATLTHTPKPMNFLNEICGRPEHERAFILLVAGYPTEGATVPKHALIKKQFEDIVTIL